MTNASALTLSLIVFAVLFVGAMFIILGAGRWFTTRRQQPRKVTPPELPRRAA